MWAAKSINIFENIPKKLFCPLLGICLVGGFCLSTQFASIRMLGVSKLYFGINLLLSCQATPPWSLHW